MPTGISKYIIIIVNVLLVNTHNIDLLYVVTSLPVALNEHVNTLVNVVLNGFLFGHASVTSVTKVTYQLIVTYIHT